MPPRDFRKLLGSTTDRAVRYLEGLDRRPALVLNQVLLSFGEPDETRRVVAAIQRDGTRSVGETPVQMP